MFGVRPLHQLIQLHFLSVYPILWQELACAFCLQLIITFNDKRFIIGFTKWVNSFPYFLLEIIIWNYETLKGSPEFPPLFKFISETFRWNLPLRLSARDC